MNIICAPWNLENDQLEEEIMMLAAQGVRAVEIKARFPQNLDTFNAQHLQQLVSVLAASGIDAYSVHAPFGQNCDISSSDDNIHDHGVDALIKTIELASILEAGVVVVHASDRLGEEFSLKQFDRANGVLREMSMVAKESGVLLALENLPPGYLGHEPEEVLTLLDGTDPDSCGVCFDCGHANLSGRIMEFAEALLPHAVAMHVHDNDGKHDQHKFPGEGNIDWEELGKVYEQSGANAQIIMECLPPTTMVWGSAFQIFRAAIGR